MDNAITEESTNSTTVSSSPTSATTPVSPIEQKTYTLKEKYYQIEPEGRIRRYQYFIRCLVPGILFFLATAFILPILVGIILPIFGIKGIMAMIYAGTIAALLSQILYIVVFYKIGLTLIAKRCHDFGSDAKLASIIFKAQLVVTIVSIILIILTLSTIEIPGSEFIGKIGQIVGVCNLIMGIILLFRPGNKGSNQYGPDSANNKVSFLG